MIAYHWLKEDMTAGNGTEPAWTVGEERSVKGKIVICERGYHSSPSLWDALEYAPGSIATVVEIGEPSKTKAALVHKDKFVSRTRKLLCAVNVEKELRQFAIDCAERALVRERDHGREPDERSWAAIEAAKAFLRGDITPAELAATWAAARAAAWAAAWAPARAATWAAAWAAASAATWDAERDWQRVRFEELVTPRIEAAMKAAGIEVAS